MLLRGDKGFSGFHPCGWPLISETHEAAFGHSKGCLCWRCAPRVEVILGVRDKEEKLDNAEQRMMGKDNRTLRWPGKTENEDI